RAITIARRVQTPHEVVDVSLRLADVLRYMGELGFAGGILDEAEMFGPSVAQQAGIARARGRIALLSGNNDAAIEALRPAIRFALRAGDTEFLCETYLDLAAALVSTGKPADAIAELTEAVDTLTLGEGLENVRKPAKLWMIGLRLAGLHHKAGNVNA